MVNQLPIVSIDGKKYYQDERLHEYRQVLNPHQRITFEDAVARKIIPVKINTKPIKQRRGL